MKKSNSLHLNSGLTFDFLSLYSKKESYKTITAQAIAKRMDTKVIIY